jgi:hypothetical protein
MDLESLAPEDDTFTLWPRRAFFRCLSFFTELVCPTFFAAFFTDAYNHYSSSFFKVSFFDDAWKSVVIVGAWDCWSYCFSRG